MTTADEPTTRYVSYLLRLRWIWDDDQPIWTGSLEDTATGSHRSFPNVETLAAFLLAEFGRRQPVAKDDAQGECPAGVGEESRSTYPSPE